MRVMARNLSLIIDLIWCQIRTGSWLLWVERVGLRRMRSCSSYVSLTQPRGMEEGRSLPCSLSLTLGRVWGWRRSEQANIMHHLFGLGCKWIETWSLQISSEVPTHDAIVNVCTIRGLLHFLANVAVCYRWSHRMCVIRLSPLSGSTFHQLLVPHLQAESLSPLQQGRFYHRQPFLLFLKESLSTSVWYQ